MIKCRICEKKTKHYARGLCIRCYKREHYREKFGVKQNNEEFKNKLVKE